MYPDGQLVASHSGLSTNQIRGAGNVSGVPDTGVNGGAVPVEQVENSIDQVPDAPPAVTRFWRVQIS